ncbi:MAG: hypothetical protein EOO06_14645 [Chitinophagaceae bacterium]|nr:MAG: hypothetical protein EOO06_14645 [Chitinophagaceae bacterium]
MQEADTNSEEYPALAAKAALHFANPYLLQERLNGTPAAIEPEVAEVPVELEAPPAEDNFDRRVEVSEEAYPAGETVKQTAQPEIAALERSAAETVNTDIAAKDESLSVPEERADTDTVAARSSNVIAASPESIPAAESQPVREPLLFEPLHTTDYFASQGIKLSEAIQPGDKMGRQLKSFTEWLKTMKKVHPESAKDKPLPDGSIDPSVQQLAEKSNVEEEVLTESMAEVYLQQGKTNKAKEIYEKLSLLNPAKNAYFAAKLNEIQ